MSDREGAAGAATPQDAPPSLHPAAPPAPGHARVLIDGLDQHLDGDVTCVRTGEETYLTVQGRATVSVGLHAGDPPQVTLIGVDGLDGLSLSYSQGGDGDVHVARDGNTYTVAGSINGVDTADPGELITKAIEITVTCP